jgi:hypothetical protein
LKLTRFHFRVQVTLLPPRFEILSINLKELKNHSKYCGAGYASLRRPARDHLSSFGVGFLFQLIFGHGCTSQCLQWNQTLLGSVVQVASVAA